MTALPNFRDGQPMREAPNNIEAEQALLGAILVNNDAYPAVEGFLVPGDFYEPIHRRIYEIAGQMIQAGKLANPITIKAFLPLDQKVGDMTMMQYLARVASEAVTVINAENYGRAVYNFARRRDLYSLGLRIMEDSSGAEAGVEPWDLAGAAERELRATVQDWRLGGEDVSTLGEAIDEAFNAIGEAYRFQKPAGLLAGIDAVDRLTGPWEPGQQIIIGGGTKQGKTALAMQLAMGMAQHGPVWVYSGEMSKKQLAMREIARRTGIPVWRQKEGRIGQSEWDSIARVKGEVQKLPIFIEKRRLTLDQVEQTLRDVKRRHGLASCVIDHIGLLNWPSQMARKDEHELAVIATQRLKAIYEGLGIPGMSLSQLKKNTFVDFTRRSYAESLKAARLRRPKYTDLMGAVERDADHVIIPFNARPILAGMEPAEGSDDYLLWEDAMRDVEGKAEIILALSREQKFPQRQEVEWHGETTSFGPSFVGKQEEFF